MTPARTTTPDSDATAATAPASPPLGEGEQERFDTAIEELHTGTQLWAALTIAQRATLLRQVRTSVAATAEDWARTAAASKGLDARHPLRGEEWLSGPYSVLGALDASIATLTRLADGRNPLDGVKVDRAPGGRARVHAFPLTGIDRFLLSGFTGEVWLRRVQRRTPRGPGRDWRSARRRGPAAWGSCSAPAT